MSRAIELVYSTQKSHFVAGRAYANPRFFTTPRAGISKVFLVGNAGGKAATIRAAYEAEGVPVEVVDGGVVTAAAASAAPTIEAPVSLTPGADANLRASVFIPDDWKELPWTPKPDQDLSLRSLAAMVSDTPIINKAQAVAAITAELERRKAAAGPKPEPTPEPVVEASASPGAGETTVEAAGGAGEAGVGAAGAGETQTGGGAAPPLTQD